MAEFFALAEKSWPEFDRCKQDPELVALLPVGSTEAHGPHLPLNTDVLIARGIVASTRRLLLEESVPSIELPELAYTVTDYAAEFAGTITIGRTTIRQLLLDIGRSLRGQGIGLLCLVNGHLEPAHRQVLRDVAEELSAAGMATVFPDYVRRRHAVRLGQEFLSGACHAGSYETSIVLAVRPDLVRWDLASTLPANPTSIGQAIQEGKRTFLEAGGDQAYFGAPAAASAEQGERLLGELARIMVESIREHRKSQ